jgi:EAL domain-containing protein (putative c-di-GMP-specific phosphodiesterase class I)
MVPTFEGRMANLAGDVANIQPGIVANPLCLLMDDDFAFRQDLAKELRRDGIDVVESSNSSQFLGIIEHQNPDIVFVNLNSAAPHECVRALLALKESGYHGLVQLFGRCETKLLESFNTVGADCSLTMLPPIQKPIKATTIQHIIHDQKLKPAAGTVRGLSLNEALLKNLITFQYQPKYDLNTNTMNGVEVMARVADPTLGLVSADQFLKGADEDDLLKLSHLAVVDAVRASRHFLDLGIALQLAVNIGIDNLLRLPIADMVTLHRPERNDWPGLILEITERQVVNRIEILKARIAKLQKAGVSIAIDNFACRSSSLEVLNQIHFAEIKIERSLIQACATDAGAANICKTLIQMAHNFGSRAVAVGISTEAELQTVMRLGCDAGQGYLLGKPMTVQQIDALIAGFKSRTA